LTGAGHDDREIAVGEAREERAMPRVHATATETELPIDFKGSGKK